MLTIHTGTNDDAVAVEGDRIAAVAAVDALRAHYPGARVREWPGELRPGTGWEVAPPDAPSPRERVHALLLRGVTAVAPGAFNDDPGLGPAAARVGLPVGMPAPLVVGSRADFAVFAADGSCLATVLAGRLVHRRR
ncbi:hypothetical protein DN069_17325 [Streptacidiphilus pinicola]|uniref:Aminodeoxyfutalosine deaminase/Imidazolonepropionase-like composite domain-containing protein n=1 Tax=Streptacidiphilus pinicola TaxID=2219663 RepID=A0A2X0IH72_9ACTN|nr:hypothetical protein [Streptacidiphilus pinicola]RAG84422.1 hypothetical protein DN069_17325 [Streptacidiphilus pinicola]